MIIGINRLHDGTGVAQDDHQFDVAARIARLNGFIPFVGFIVLGTSFVVAYAALVYAKMKQIARFA